MKPIPSDYEPPATTEKYPDGKYLVKGFEWFTLDDKQRPIIVSQKNGVLVGRLRFIRSDEKEGPPMSLTLGEMSLLAKAFGVDAGKLSSTPAENQGGLISQFMTDIKNLCNGTSKELTVESKDGWVNTVPGMEAPEGYFYFVLVDVSSKEKEENGDVKPQVGDYGPYFWVGFEIVAGEGGSETPFKGARFNEIVNYAVSVGEDGKADWERSPVEKRYTAQAMRLSKLMSLTAPDLFIEDFNPPNPHNILPYWKKEALSAQKILKGSRAKEVTKDGKGAIRLVWGSLQEVTGFAQPQRLIEEMDVDDKMRKVLVEALDNLADGKSTIDGTYDLSPKGLEIAKKYLSPLKKEGKIKHGALKDLTPEEVTTILTHLTEEAKLDQSYKERAIMLGVGFEAPPVEEEDSPF